MHSREPENHTNHVLPCFLIMQQVTEWGVSTFDSKWKENVSVPPKPQAPLGFKCKHSPGHFFYHLVGVLRMEVFVIILNL